MAGDTDPILIPTATGGLRRIALRCGLKRRFTGVVDYSFLLRVSDTLQQLLQDVT
jgi:hypothetical protein